MAKGKKRSSTKNKVITKKGEDRIQVQIEGELYDVLKVEYKDSTTEYGIKGFPYFKFSSLEELEKFF